jgi:catechol 2,3-dioxygenase-like lactoylglutathione lyase family enzyme
MIKSADHYGITVSRIEDTLHFFCDLLGLKATPVSVVDNPDVQKIVGTPGAVLRISIVSLPDNSHIELIEYVKPKGVKVEARLRDTGAAHIACVVDDLQKIYTDLTKRGVKFINPPVTVPGNEGTGTWNVTFVRGPDDLTLELIEKKS